MTHPLNRLAAVWPAFARLWLLWCHGSALARQREMRWPSSRRAWTPARVLGMAALVAGLCAVVALGMLTLMDGAPR